MSKNLYDLITENYEWYTNVKVKVVTFQTTSKGSDSSLYIAAIVPEKSHFDSILASENPSIALNENILLSQHSWTSCSDAISDLFRKTKTEIGKALVSTSRDPLVFEFKNNQELEKLRKEILDTPNKNASESENSLPVSGVVASAVKHSRMIDELQKTCEALKGKFDSLEKKNEELERRVITDIGSSIAEGLHTKMEKLIGDGLSQLTDKNLSLLEKENMAEATQGPLQSKPMMTPNSSAVSDTDVTITSIQGLDHTSETGVVGTWNKIRAVDKQLGWLFSTGVLGDDRMKRYIHQDLKQLANDINAYLDENK